MKFSVVLYYMFCYYLPNNNVPYIGSLSKKIREHVCRRIFVKCGTNVNVQRRVYFGMNKIYIGSNSGLGENFHLQNCSLIIGENVLMAPNVTILGGGHIYKDKTKLISEQGVLEKSELRIGNDCWIGRNVTILGKVNNIGNGVVIGACSVITHDVPDYAVVAGNPARIIKYRE